MNNKIIIVAVVTVVLIGGGMIITNQKSKAPENPKMAPDNVMVTMTQEQIAAERAKALEVNSSYVPYSKETIDEPATGRRVLFFYASWCPTCVPTDKNLSQNTSLLPNDVTVIRVNFNDPDTDQEEKDLAKKYGVTYQHTFVQIDSQGKEITKWNGGQIEELLGKIR